MKKPAKQNKPTSAENIIQAGSGLKIVSQQEKRLSKNQQTFNKLIEEVESLNCTIKSESRRLEKLLQEYGKKLPQEKKFAAAQLSIAIALDTAANTINLSRRQIESVRNVILWFCLQSFRRADPTEKGKALYDKWNGTSYDDEQKEHEFAQKQKLAAELNELYDLGISASEIDITPEGYARLRERIKQVLENREEKKESEPEKKTEKQSHKERKKKELSSEKLKSLRAIYLSLAKMLHPDTATDATEKLRKEELMKRVANAYRDKDLTALLSLELEFVTEKTHLQSLADDKLKVYIASLKEQVTALRHELFRTRHHPRFTEIADLVDLPPKTAEKELQTKAKQIKLLITEAERAGNFLHGNFYKKSVMSFVDNMEADIAEMEGL